MKEEIVRDIVQAMTSSLDSEQLDKLKNVLYIKLVDVEMHSKSYEITEYDNKSARVLDKFIACKRLEGLAESSLERYRADISKMLEYLNIDIKDISTDNIRYYLAMYQEHRKVSKTTLNNMRRYFSTFFAWLVENDYIIRNPMSKIKRIKGEKKIKQPFTDKEMEQIRENVSRLRDRAVVELLNSTACRVSEVVRMNIDDINYSDSSIVVVGKGSKQRKVYVSERCMYYLQKYLNARRDNNPALIVNLNRKAQRLGKQGIECMLRKIGLKTKIHVYPHKFRRTTATNALNDGMKPHEVQKMLGHSSFDTTAIYCTVDDENVRLSHKRFIA